MSKQSRKATKTQVTPTGTQASAVLAGSCGQAARGFALATLASQTAFRLGLAYNQSQRAQEVPVFDADTAAAMGDAGLPATKPLDLEELTRGYAASFVLLTSHIKKPNPDNNGRRDEHLKRFLKHPKKVVEDAIDFRAQRQITEAKATAVMLYGKYGEMNGKKSLINAKECEEKAWPRVEAIQNEMKKQLESNIGPVVQNWLAALTAYIHKDDNELQDIAMEAMTNAGDNPTEKIRQAAEAFLDSQRRRMESGGFVRIDAGIYSLAGTSAA